MNSSRISDPASMPNSEEQCQTLKNASNYNKANVAFGMILSDTALEQFKTNHTFGQIIFSEFSFNYFIKRKCLTKQLDSQRIRNTGEKFF